MTYDPHDSRVIAARDLLIETTTAHEKAKVELARAKEAVERALYHMNRAVGNFLALTQDDDDKPF